MEKLPNKKNDNLTGSTLIKRILEADRVSKDIGLLKCIQCGTCSSSCPAARYSEFSPRKIMNAILTRRKQILQDKLIWNCFSCYTCHMRCPRGNSPTTVIQVLKQLSIEKGYNREQLLDFIAYGESFIEIGAGSFSQSMVEKLYEDWGETWLQIRLQNEEIRKELSLESAFLPLEARKEIHDILERTGFVQRIEKLKEPVK